MLILTSCSCVTTNYFGVFSLDVHTLGGVVAWADLISMIIYMLLLDLSAF